MVDADLAAERVTHEKELQAKQAINREFLGWKTRSSSPGVLVFSASVCSRKASCSRMPSTDHCSPQRRTTTSCETGRRPASIRRCEARYGHPSGRAGRRHRREPANPGKFFYDNLMMGIQMMEVGRRRGLEEIRGHRHDLRLSQVHPDPVQGGGSLERLPGRDQRALRPRQEDAAGSGSGLPPAIWLQCRFFCFRSTSTARATISTCRHRTSFPPSSENLSRHKHEGDPEMVLWGDGSALCGSSSMWRMPRRAILLQPNTTMGVIQ